MPIQQPHPPMWVGGVSEPALRRAARLGDGWISANMQPLDEIVALSDKYRGFCADEGRAPFLCISRDSWVAASRDDMMRDWYGDMVNRHIGFKRLGFAKIGRAHV